MPQSGDFEILKLLMVLGLWSLPAIGAGPNETSSGTYG